MKVSFFFLSLSPPVFRSAASSKSLASRLRTSISSFLPRVRRLLIVLERSPALKVRISRRPVRRGDSFPQLSILYESNGAKKKKKNSPLPPVHLIPLLRRNPPTCSASLSLSLPREARKGIFHSFSGGYRSKGEQRAAALFFFFGSLFDPEGGGAQRRERHEERFFRIDSSAIGATPSRFSLTRIHSPLKLRWHPPRTAGRSLRRDGTGAAARP